MKECFLTQHQQTVPVEEEDVAIPIVGTLLLVEEDADMKDMEKDVKDQREIMIMIEMSDNIGEMTQSVACMGGTYGDNAMITQEGKAFVPQEILLVVQMDRDAMNFMDEMIFVQTQIHHIKPTVPPRWTRSNILSTTTTTRCNQGNAV
jgi:hypothetical protein